MGRNKTGLIVLLLLLLFFLFKRKPDGGGGGGGGAGPAVPSGTLSTVNVNQVALVGSGLLMGSHQLPRNVGDPVTVRVMWTPTTKDALGQPVNWEYSLDYDLINAATGMVERHEGLGTMTNVPSGPSVNSTFSPSLTQLPGIYDLRVTLYGAVSSPTGQPGGNSTPLGSFNHTQALWVS